MRANLLASATKMSMRGWRATIRYSLEPLVPEARCLADHRTAANDQKLPDAALPHSRHTAKSRLTASRVPTRNEAEPGRKIAAFAEGLDKQSQGEDGSARNGTDTKYGHQPTCIFVFLDATRDPAAECSGVIAQFTNKYDHELEYGERGLWQFRYYLIFIDVVGEGVHLQLPADFAGPYLPIRLQTRPDQRQRRSWKNHMRYGSFLRSNPERQSA